MNFLWHLALQGKKTWWRLTSRCWWNHVRHWHASEFVSFLVGLRTYQHLGTCNVILPVKYVLYFCVSTFHNMCAVHRMAVFCSSLISCFPCVLLSYCPSDFEMVPFAPIITGITFAFTVHMYWISIVRSLYFKIFSVSFLIAFLSPEIETSVNVHVPCLLSQIMMSSLLLGIVLLVHTCWF